MSAQNFLSNFASRVKEVIAGDDYLDLDKADRRTTKQRTGEWRLDRNRQLNQHRVGQTTPPGTTINRQYRPVTRPNSAPSASTVNSSPISSPINPKPTTATAPRPVSSVAQTNIDARAGQQAQRALSGGSGLMRFASNAGGLFTALTTGGQIGTAMRDNLPQTTFVSGRGGGSRATNNPLKNSPDPLYTANPEAPKTPDTYTVSGVTYDSKTGQAINPETGKISPNGYSIDPSSVKKTDDISAPTRDTPSPNGGEGSGTQTSPGGGGIIMSAEDAARFYQSRGLGAFSSIQLPGTQTNPITGTTIEAVPFGGQETSVTQNSLGAYTANNGQAYPSLDETKPGAKFNGQAQTIAGGAERIGASANPSQTGKSFKEISPSDPIYAKAFGEDLAKKYGKGSLREALADKTGMQPEMTDERRQLMANAAFMAQDDTMMGLRAKEKVLDQMYAGGQTYMLNEDGSDFLKNKEGKNVAADKGAKRAYMSGNMSAQDYRNTFTDAVMGLESNPLTPKDAENLNAKNPVAVAAQSTEQNPGSLIDVEKSTRDMETSKGLTGIQPYADGEAYGQKLNGEREPLMRDELPITVPRSQIPQEGSPDLQKYLDDLDAGKLTRPNPYRRR